MLGESFEFCCEDVVFVRVIRLAGFVMFKLVLEAVDLRETVGGERLGLFEGGLEGGVTEGEDNGRGFFGV